MAKIVQLQVLDGHTGVVLGDLTAPKHFFYSEAATAWGREVFGALMGRALTSTVSPIRVDIHRREWEG